MTIRDTAVKRDREIWQELKTLTDAANGQGLQRLLEDVPASETVRAMFRLSADDQRRLVGLLSPDSAADLLEDLPEVHAVELIENLELGHAADIVEEFASDQRADLLSEMDSEEAEAILGEMIPEIADEVRELISYPTDVAGGLMEIEHYAYPAAASVGDFLQALRHSREVVGELPQRLVMTDKRGRPVGAVEIADVLLADSDVGLPSLSAPVTSVSAEASLDELADYFDRHETLGAPVVDKNGRLVGRVRRRAVFEAIAERNQEDYLKVQGIVGGEELRAMPVLTRSRRRLSWLSINILLNILAASVIAIFQDTLSAVIALAVFLPIVSDMSGCSGNQAVAVSMRELTLGIVQPRDAFRVWWQEVSVGLLNGIALGLLLSIATFLWQGSPLLGIVVGVALALNTVIAVSIGGTVPLLLKGLRADPAVASGPVLTTITDMCGFFLVLGLATLALPWLA
jgi:magnesium transporter